MSEKVSWVTFSFCLLLFCEKRIGNWPFIRLVRLFQSSHSVYAQLQTVRVEEVGSWKLEKSNWWSQQGKLQTEIKWRETSATSTHSFGHCCFALFELQSSSAKPVAQAPSPYRPNWTSRGTGTPSPISPTPSPAGSVGSVGSVVSSLFLDLDNFSKYGLCVHDSGILKPRGFGADKHAC